MHVGDERLQRLLDGELPPAQEAEVRAHVAGCAECRHALMEAEHEDRQALVLMRALDEPAPDLNVERIVALGSGQEEPVTGPPEPPTTTWVRKRRPVLGRRMAALALALVLGGAAYAIPGSPLPRWVRGVVQRIRPERAQVAPRPEPADAAGIAVIPGSDLVIEFRSRQAEGLARVTLTDQAELVIRAPGGAATFTADVDRLVVNNRGRASFEIQVPRAAPRVEIRVEGVPVFLKEGARVTLASPAGEGVYQIPLALR